MKKIKLFVTLITFLSFSVSVNLFGQNDTTEIIILHTNDMHSKIDNMAKLAYYVDYYKTNNENVYLFSAGDNFTGNPIVDQYTEPGYPMVDLMNKIHFDLSCIGNHEFDYGQINLNKLRKQADFPFISANIERNESAILTQPVSYHKFTTKNNVSIGVLGLTQVNRHGIPDCSPLKIKNLSFKDPIAMAKKYKNYRDSSDIFIGLTHLGYKNDLKLVKKVKFLDAVIGGHSHTNLPSGELKGNTLIAHADSYVDFLGVMNIKVVNHKVISKTDTLLNIKNSTKSDKAIFELIKKYNNNPSLHKVIGKAEDDITGKGELGSMMTDAIRDTLNVDIAFQNNGGIRARHIPKGDISVKQILELSPFGNTLVEYNLTPKQIKKLIKYAYVPYNSNDLQVSGLIINLDVSAKGKLLNINLKDTEDKELTKETYSVAVNDYMAASYELKFFKSGKKHPIIDAENLIHFIKKNKSINYKGVKRVFVNKKESSN